MAQLARSLTQRCAGVAMQAALRSGLHQRLLTGAPFGVLALLAGLACAEPLETGQSKMDNTVYKCGSAGHVRYEDKPCREGHALDVSDPRTPAEQAEALARTARQTQEADSLRQERMQAEQREILLLQQAQRQAAQQAQTAPPSNAPPPVVVVVRPGQQLTAPQTPPPWPVWPQTPQWPAAQKPAPAPAPKASQAGPRDPLRP